MSKKIKPEDLHIGMRVNTMQLSNIYDTYILLSQTELSSKNDGSTDGTIQYMKYKSSSKHSLMCATALSKN